MSTLLAVLLLVTAAGIVGYWALFALGVVQVEGEDWYLCCERAFPVPRYLALRPARDRRLRWLRCPAVARPRRGGTRPAGAGCRAGPPVRQHRTAP